MRIAAGGLRCGTKRLKSRLLSRVKDENMGLGEYLLLEKEAQELVTKGVYMVEPAHKRCRGKGEFSLGLIDSSRRP